MPAILNEQQSSAEPLKEDHTGWYVTRALRRLLLELNQTQGTSCTDAEVNIIAYLIYKGMAECRSRAWFLEDLRRTVDDDHHEPKYGWVATSANQLSDPDRAGVVCCSESKTGELLNKLIDLGVLVRREDPNRKRYFHYRVEYLHIAELMREAGECFLLPRVYDEENINLTDRCIEWGRVFEEETSATTGPQPRPKETRHKEQTAHDPTPAPIAIEIAKREVAPAVDTPRRDGQQPSPGRGGSPGRGDIIDLKDLYTTSTHQPPTASTDILSTSDPVQELAEQFHEAFRYVPGQKKGIKTALCDLLQRGHDQTAVQAALAYTRWRMKRPGSPLENPVGWFKTCVTRQFWESDPRYRTYQKCRRRRENNNRSSPAFDPDGEERLSPETFRKKVAWVLREAGLTRDPQGHGG